MISPCFRIGQFVKKLNRVSSVQLRRSARVFSRDETADDVFATIIIITAKNFNSLQSYIRAI